uniref:Uncharacterized protein n=1 Tax=Marseillevirus LCMAC202 TaxID=2506606 RepID=A0A481YXA2_9VIRU|nr:MAG: hypothetical protein LCMAC202_02130 [Marseillevirus LCMAC202]
MMDVLTPLPETTLVHFGKRSEAAQPRKNFNISQMSLSKKNYQIDTPLQALQILKNCLSQTNVGFQEY